MIYLIQFASVVSIDCYIGLVCQRRVLREFMAKNERYMVLESFLSLDEQRAIVGEVLTCHQLHGQDGEGLKLDLGQSTSMKMELGIGCGEDLSSKLKVSVHASRRAFQVASENFLPMTSALRTLSDPTTPMTGLSLLYNPSASMSAHYDSPTQPGRMEEWLCSFTLGMPCLFRLNECVIALKSGDALVMDSMAVLHGVERILESRGDDICSQVGLPVEGRLGVLLWHGRLSVDTYSDIPVVEGLSDMFANSDSEA